MNSSLGTLGRRPAIEQHQRFRGEGDFDVLIEDENGIQIEVNGTIDEIHNEQLDGLLSLTHSSLMASIRVPPQEHSDQSDKS